MNVYDFDKTIYLRDSSFDFYLFCLKKKPALAFLLPKQLLFIALYKCSIISKEKAKEAFFCFLKHADNIQGLLDAFWDTHFHFINDWYLQQKKEDDVVISASPVFLLKPVCERLEIKHLIASEFDIQTGMLSGKNCYGEEKVRRIKEVFGNDIVIDEFYSDSESDLPLANLAKSAFLVKKGNVVGWK